MLRPRRSLLLVLALAALAPAAGVEGFFCIAGKEGGTVRIARGKQEGVFVGVVVAATGDWHRQQLNQAVLELRRVGENAYRGRCSAYHARVSDDMDAWVEVAEASLLPSGALRCLLKVPGEGSIQFVYERGEGAERPGKEGGGRDLAGEWADAAGAVLVFRRQGEILTGHVVRTASPEKGAARKETMRVKAMGGGAYKGTIELSSPDGAKVELVEDIEVAVRGNALSCVRTTKEGKVTWTAQRLSTEGDKGADAPKGAPELDPDDICGKWRTPQGDATRYTRNGDRWTGHVAVLSPQREAFGFRIGEEAVRLRRIAPGYYVGKVLVKTEGGKDSWWEDIEFTVNGDALRFVRHTTEGKLDKGTATRLTAPPEEQPQPPPERK